MRRALTPLNDRALPYLLRVAAFVAFHVTRVH